MLANTKRNVFIEAWKKGVAHYSNLTKKSTNMAEDYTVWCYERKKERQEFLKDFGDLPKMINELVLSANRVFCQNKRSLLFCFLNLFEKQRLIVKKLITDVERKLSISGSTNIEEKTTDIKKFLLKRKSTFHVTEIKSEGKDSDSGNSSDGDGSGKENSPGVGPGGESELEAGLDQSKVMVFFFFGNFNSI